MLLEILLYCDILYCVLSNVCIMYLLIQDCRVVLALSCCLNGEVSYHRENVHYISVVPVFDLLGILQPEVL